MNEELMKKLNEAAKKAAENIPEEDQMAMQGIVSCAISGLELNGKLTVEDITHILYHALSSYYIFKVEYPNMKKDLKKAFSSDVSRSDRSH